MKIFCCYVVFKITQPRRKGKRKINVNEQMKRFNFAALWYKTNEYYSLVNKDQRSIQWSEKKKSGEIRNLQQKKGRNSHYRITFYFVIRKQTAPAIFFV